MSLRYKIMKIQTQQRMPLSNRGTRNETSVSSAISILLKLNKEIELSYNYLGAMQPEQSNRSCGSQILFCVHAGYGNRNGRYDAMN